MTRLEKLLTFITGVACLFAAYSVSEQIRLGDELQEFKERAVQLEYADWASIGYGQTEFRFKDSCPVPPTPVPSPHPRPRPTPSPGPGGRGAAIGATE